jgi:hypothetical protein
VQFLMQRGHLRLALGRQLRVNQAPVCNRLVMRALPVPHEEDALLDADGSVDRAREAAAAELPLHIGAHVIDLAHRLVRDHEQPVRAKLLRRLDDRAAAVV